MSNNVIRRTLWLVFLVGLPVPYWVFEPGWVPTLWLGELTAFVLAMLLSEGGTVTRIVATLFASQTLLFAGLTYMVARLLTRLLGRVPSEAGRTFAALGTAALVLVAAMLPIYRSPLVAGGAPVNLLRLFG